MAQDSYDLCVIGGGVNGAGIARDAAGRGLRVLLVEAQDLAGATSSASSKLIHGGLRYLEYFEFKLVREALKEREVLMDMAPHIIWPLDFVLPYRKKEKGQRPFWMIRAGLFLYDHLAKRKKLGASYGLNLRKHPFGKPLREEFARGFGYADCWVDDARLVVLNAMDAQHKGAEILTRTACVHMQPEGEEGWRLKLRDMMAGSEREVQAKIVVNAAGPWVRGVLEHSGLVKPEADVPEVRLVKGSHIIVPRQYEGDQVYILQQKDGRIVFVIPYEGDYTLIGTTEVDFYGDPTGVQISQREVQYLCDAYNAAFTQEIKPEDVRHSYSGVRPLMEDGGESATSVSRDYHLHDHTEFAAPLISVFGGKITTYRVLAEDVVDRLMEKSGRKESWWTEGAVLPGGDFDEDFYVQQNDAYPWLDAPVLQRYLHSYGTLMDVFLERAQGPEDLGVCYGDGVYEAEILYLIRCEWARSLEDILWRRTKLGLHISEQTEQKLEAALPELLERGL